MIKIYYVLSDFFTRLSAYSYINYFFVWLYLDYKDESIINPGAWAKQTLGEIPYSRKRPNEIEIGLPKLYISENIESWESSRKANRLQWIFDQRVGPPNLPFKSNLPNNIYLFY